MIEATQAVHSSRRWLRLSLRTSLLLVGAAAVVLGYIAHCENVRRAAAERIKPLGGYVAWQERGPRWLTRLIGRDVFATPREVVFMNEPLQDDDLKALSGLEEARHLSISQNSTFTGSGFRHLASMQNLESLYVYDVPLTDEGIANLPKISTLRKIELYATVMTDKSIPLIKEFDYVSEIQVGSDALTRSAVEALDASMPSTRVGWSGQGYGGE